MTPVNNETRQQDEKEEAKRGKVQKYVFLLENNEIQTD